VCSGIIGPGLQVIPDVLLGVFEAVLLKSALGGLELPIPPPFVQADGQD
jgi:hypothetical protein